MHLVNLQKAVLGAAIIDEGRLEIVVDIVDDAPVDVALDFGLMEHLQIIFAHAALFGQHNLRLLPGHNADEHFLLGSLLGRVFVPWSGMFRVFFGPVRVHRMGGSAPRVPPCPRRA